MKRSLARLTEIHARLARRVLELEDQGRDGRADLIDSARRRVQRARELRMLEQSSSSKDEAAE